ncbi:hypothetical protein ABZY81_15510 [Streptomyces sp. NPDC006514]|uniref:hypothetical protein n=1 Tax=Streptomyces sp. NPDC006514 TaxID=3154308 RepID=UPI0033BB4A08
MSHRARVAALLEESPLTAAAVLADVRHLLAHGTRQCQAGLVALAADTAAAPACVRGLDELLVD